MKPCFALLGCVALSSPLLAATYGVAPWGNDAAAGTVAAPFRTLAKAVAAAQAGDTVQLRQGVYRETLNAVRSGTTAAPIVFKGASGEEAVLSGADSVAGAWSVYSGKIWKIDGLAATWDVYVDGQEMPEARWPNVTPGAPMDAGWATADAGSGANTLVDAALPSGTLNGAQVRIIPGSAWVAYSRTVQSYGGGQFTFSSAVGANASYWPKSGNLYYLYRHLSLLDSAGEWYQDPSTQRLYLWLPDGGSPSAHSIEVAARKTVAVINGYSHIELRDLFSFSGGISFSHSSGSQVVGVNQRYVQQDSEVDGYNYPVTANGFDGGSGCTWSGGSIQGSSGDGLHVAGSGHSVKDMLIHDVDRIGTYRAAIDLTGSDPIVSHNTLYDSGRFLIYHGGVKGGSLDHNELYSAGLLTKDLGATYCYRTDGGGMVIAYNHVHDVHCDVGAGIYLDNGSSNFVIHHNLVHDISWFALKLNLPSYGNLVVNNTLYGEKYWVNASYNSSNPQQEMTGTALVNNLTAGSSKLVTGAMAPSLTANNGYSAPPAIFNSGAWTLAPGSPAIDKGVVKAPYTDGYCGAKPDQGCFESNCSAPWTAGDEVTPPAFPYPPADLNPGTPTRTQTPVSTRTPTPTDTRTRTRTASPSATRTATATVTASATRSASPAPTGTVTGSATPTATLSATRTVSPAPTATATPTSSRSATRTASPTFTRTATSTATTTVTPTPTATVTLSHTASPSETPSATRTASPPPTATVSPSASATATPSESPVATGTTTPSPTASSSPTGTVAATPLPPEGPLVLRQAVPFPQPVQPGLLRLRVDCGGHYDRLRLRLYTAALVLVLEAEQDQGGSTGWSEARFSLPPLPQGLYYLRLQAQRGQADSQPLLKPIYLLGR